jgi:asparagine synthetase B (glutamine-hydrolysing)
MCAARFNVEPDRALDRDCLAARTDALAHRGPDGLVQGILTGGIYSFLEVRYQLVAHGHRFRTGSDPEVIVHGSRPSATAAG